MKQTIRYDQTSAIRTVAALLAAAVLCAGTTASATQLTPIGVPAPNQGNLLMHEYVAGGVGAGLVVLLHGCGQAPAAYLAESGWGYFADAHGFNIVMAEQQTTNNTDGCFNWFLPGDNTRGNGEASSIKQMVDYMQGTYGIAPGKTFVSGFSAGAAMSAAMLATYPDVFDGGAINAGVPYGCANDAWTALACMTSPVYKTAAQWGAAVRAACPPSNLACGNARPKVIILHGSADTTVNYMKLNESMQQWTNVHGVSQFPTGFQWFDGHPARSYSNKVMTVSVTGMGHAVSTDPNDFTNPCGTAGPNAANSGLCSTVRTANFWGLF